MRVSGLPSQQSIRYKFPAIDVSRLIAWIVLMEQDGDMRLRTGNKPKRRITPNVPAADVLATLAARVRYVGSGHHKRNPADYGLERTSPRPTKSLCDGERPLKLEEARELLRTGILRGMISELAETGFPQYVWCVSPEGKAYEARTDPKRPGDYHGYPIEDEDDMRRYVKKVWEERCPAFGK